MRTILKQNLNTVRVGVRAAMYLPFYWGIILFANKMIPEFSGEKDLL